MNVKWQDERVYFITPLFDRFWTCWVHRKSLPLASLPFYFFQEDQSFKMLETSDYCYYLYMCQCQQVQGREWVFSLFLYPWIRHTLKKSKMLIFQKRFSRLVFLCCKWLCIWTQLHFLCFQFPSSRFKKIIPIPEQSMVQMLCYLLECLLTEENTPPDCPKELYELYFVFAAVWAFGGSMFQDQVRRKLLLQQSSKQASFFFSFFLFSTFQNVLYQ